MLSSKARTTLLGFFLSLFICSILQQTALSSRAYGTTDQWQYIGDYESVDLYRCLRETEGLLPFKAVAVLDLPYDKIIMALIDAERKATWAPKLKSVTVHSQQSSNCFEFSEYYETPWPFKDREFLLAGTVTYQHDQILFSAANSENFQLAREDHLRADIQVLTLAVIPLSKSRTKVVFTFSGDMGGWIPAFVKTIIQKKWPVRFIQALKEYVANHDFLETDRYRSLEKSGLILPLP